MESSIENHQKNRIIKMIMIQDPEKEISYFKFSKGYSLTYLITEKISADHIINVENKNNLPLSSICEHNFESLPIPKYYSWEQWQKIFNK